MLRNLTFIIIVATSATACGNFQPGAQLDGVVLAEALSAALRSAESGFGRYPRYQMRESAPTTILDTSTGQLWIATLDREEGGYVMRRVCYYGPNGQRMPTPYEDDFVSDLSIYEADCAPWAP